jgi:integrase
MEEESEPGTCRAFAAETNRRNTSADRGTPRTFGRQSKRPIRRVKVGWKATLRRAGVPHFPIYNLRHAFCARLSRVAPDAVIRHTSPETKRIYQLSMVEQVREAMEKANQRPVR